MIRTSSPTKSASSSKSEGSRQNKPMQRMFSDTWTKIKSYGGRIQLNLKGPLRPISNNIPGEKTEALDNKSSAPSPIFKIEGLSQSLRFEQAGNHQEEESQDNKTDHIQILRPEGLLVIGSYGSRNRITSRVKDKIRREVVEHSRMLHLQAYEKDIMELLISTQGLNSTQNSSPRKYHKHQCENSEYHYVFYKVHREVIIYAVACSSYSYENAERIIETAMQIYDEEIFQLFGQLRLPKVMTHSYWRKLSNLNRRLRQTLQHENQHSNNGPETLLRVKSETSEKIRKVSQSNMRQIAEDCLILHNEDMKLKSSLKTGSASVQKFEKMREDTGRIVSMMGIRRISFYVLLMLNLALLLYLISNYS